MYTIEKEFSFSASHRLDGLPDDHPCSRLHGHNYVIRVRLESDKLNEIGFVRDYRELDDVKKWIDDNFDHQDLNEYFIGSGTNPTAENLAEHLFDRFCYYPELIAVGVSETPKTWAWFSR